MATLHKQSMIVKTFQPEDLHHIGDSPKDSAFSDRMIYATHISSSAIVSLIGGLKNCGSSHQLPSYRSSSGVSTLRCQNNVAIKTDSKVNCNRLLDGYYQVSKHLTRLAQITDKKKPQAMLEAFS